MSEREPTTSCGGARARSGRTCWGSPANRCSRTCAARERDRLLLVALRGIPIDFQITDELFHCEEMSLEEIAGVLEVAVGTVKRRLGRARVMLREQLERLAADPHLAETTTTNLQHWAGALRDALARPE